HRHRYATGDVVVVAVIEIGQDAGPHQKYDRAVAVIVVHHRTAHLDQRRPQRIQCLNIEFRCRVKSPGRDRAGRGKHAVATHQLTGVVLAHQQVVAVLVEAVDVQAVALPGQRETRLAAEDV